MNSLACVLALASCAPATGVALAATNPAETVPFDTWDDSVQTMYDEGILEGYPRTHEGRVDQPMTRYEFAVAWAKLAQKLGLQHAAEQLPDLRTDVPPGHWACQSVEYLASVGPLPAEAFDDVDALHWAARPVAVLSGEASRGQPRYLLFRGDEPLMRREYMEMVHRTACALRAAHPDRFVYSDLRVTDVEGFMVDEGLLIGYPRTHELRPHWPMTRRDFCLATSRLLDDPAFARE
jgi:hypothetical protein